MLNLSDGISRDILNCHAVYDIEPRVIKPEVLYFLILGMYGMQPHTPVHEQLQSLRIAI